MRHKIKIVVGCVLIITGFLATNIADQNLCPDVLFQSRKLRHFYIFRP